MPLFKRLEEIRKKSEQTKKRTVFILTVLVMILVVIVWLTFLIFSKEDTGGPIKNDYSPMSIIKDLKSLKDW